MSLLCTEGTRDSRKGKLGTWRTVWEGQLSIANFLLNFLDFLPCDYIMYSKNKCNYKKNSHTHGLGSSSGKGTCPKPGTVPVFLGAQERGMLTLSGWPVMRTMHPGAAMDRSRWRRELTPRAVLVTTSEHLNLPYLALFSHINLVSFKNQ